MLHYSTAAYRCSTLDAAPLIPTYGIFEDTLSHPMPWVGRQPKRGVSQVDSGTSTGSAVDVSCLFINGQLVGRVIVPSLMIRVSHINNSFDSYQSVHRKERETILTKHPFISLLDTCPEG